MILKHTSVAWYDIFFVFIHGLWLGPTLGVSLICLHRGSLFKLFFQKLNFYLIQHIYLNQGLANLFCKGPDSILGLAFFMVSILTTHSVIINGEVVDNT